LQIVYHNHTMVLITCAGCRQLLECDAVGTRKNFDRFKWRCSVCVDNEVPMVTRYDNDVLVADGVTNEYDAARLLAAILDSHTPGEAFGNNVRGSLTQSCWTILKKQQPHPWIEREVHIGCGLRIWKYTCEGTNATYEGVTAQQEIIRFFVHNVGKDFVARYAQNEHEDYQSMVTILGEVSEAFAQKIGGPVE